LSPSLWVTSPFIWVVSRVIGNDVENPSSALTVVGHCLMPDCALLALPAGLKCHPPD